MYSHLLYLFTSDEMATMAAMPTALIPALTNYLSTTSGSPHLLIRGHNIVTNYDGKYEWFLYFLLCPIYFFYNIW